MVERSEPHKDPTHAGAGASPDKRRPLQELLSYIADNTPPSNTYPELADIDYFRRAWGRARSTELLRQSRVQVPDNAGPLNTSSLMHRSLSLMRAQSPAYLEHFLGYIDALAWIEQLTGGASSTTGRRSKTR